MTKNKPGSSTNMLLQPVIIVLQRTTNDGMATKKPGQGLEKMKKNS